MGNLIILLALTGFAVSPLILMEIEGTISIDYVLTENSTISNLTSTVFLPVPGMEYTYTLGKDYLTIMSAEYEINSFTHNLRFRAQDIAGTNGYQGTNERMEQTSGTAGNNWFTWFAHTATPTSDDIVLALDCVNQPSTYCLSANHQILAIDLEPLTPNVDYFNTTSYFGIDNGILNEQYNSGWYGVAYNSTWLETPEQPTLTFTPPVGGHDWLILTQAMINTTSLAFQQELRGNITGSINDTFGYTSREFEDLNEAKNSVLANVYNLDSSSHTITLQAKSTCGACGSIRSAQIFALDLNNFATKAWNYSAPDVLIVKGNPDNELKYGNSTHSLNFNVAQNDPVLLIGIHNYNASSATAVDRQALYLDGTAAEGGTILPTVIPDRDTTNFDGPNSHDVLDELNAGTFAIENLTAGSHTLDLVEVSGSVTHEANRRFLLAFSLSILSVPNAPTNLNVTLIGDDNNHLQWTHFLDNGTNGFRIQRESPIGAGFSNLVANTSNTDLQYFDENLTCGTDYNYRVAALNSEGASAWSNEANQTTATCPAVTDVPGFSIIEWGVYGFFAYSSLLMLIISVIKEVPNTKAMAITRSIFLIPGMIAAAMIAGAGSEILVQSADITNTIPSGVNSTSTEVWTVQLQSTVWVTFHYLVFIVLLFYVVMQLMILITRKE